MAVCYVCLVAQPLLTLCNHMDYSPPGSSFHEDSPGMEGVAISSSRRSSQPKDGTQVSHIAGRFSTTRATEEAPNSCTYPPDNILEFSLLTCNPKIFIFPLGFFSESWPTSDLEETVSSKNRTNEPTTGSLCCCSEDQNRTGWSEPVGTTYFCRRETVTAAGRTGGQGWSWSGLSTA